MSSLFPRSKVITDGKNKKGKTEVKAKSASTTEDGLFGVAVKKRNDVLNNDSKTNKRMKSTNDGDLEKEEDIDNVGDLIKMVKSPSGKGRIPRIVPPSFQHLAKGTLLYGIIKIVTKREMFIALPFGLNGLVSSSEVSDFTLFKDSGAELLNGDDQDDQDDEEEEKEEKSVVGSNKKTKGSAGGGSSLESLFKVGQTVKCAVLNSTETKGGRRSVQLTLKPSVVNRGVFLEHLGTGSSIYGAVASVEVRALKSVLSFFCFFFIFFNIY